MKNYQVILSLLDILGTWGIWSEVVVVIILLLLFVVNIFKLLVVHYVSTHFQPSSIHPTL